MENEITTAELLGRIEAIRATQHAMLIALGLQEALDIAGVSRVARNMGSMSNVQGDALVAMNRELDALDALAALPKR